MSSNPQKIKKKKKNNYLQGELFLIYFRNQRFNISMS